MSGRKKRYAVLLAVVAVCAIAAATAGARTQRASLSGTLNIYGFGPGDDVATNRFNYAASQLQGVTINNPAGAFNDQAFLTQLASGNVPDLVYMDRNFVGTYAAKGVLQPLDQCIAPVKSQYRKSALAQVTYKGHVYGIPEFTQPITLLANGDAFKDAGVPISQAQTTNWPKLLATAKKLTKFDANGNLVRIGFDPRIPEDFPLWVRWFGGKANLISADGLKAELNTKPAIRALDFTAALINAQGGWKKFDSFRQTFDWFGKQNPFVRNQIGFLPHPSWLFNVFSNNSPTINLVVHYFTNHAGGPISMYSGSAWEIPKGAKNFDAACAFAKAITSVQSWENAAKKRFDVRKAQGSTFTGLYTANAIADAKIYEDIYQSFGHPAFDDAVKLAVNANRFGLVLPVSPGGEQLVNAWTDAINRVLNGQQTPKQALDQAQKEVQTAIDANK
jgi:multiple sugar transport system substrate-binding protein